MGKLWSIFRGSAITKYLKNYLMKEGRMVVIGCVATDEEQEEESYQTLMLCKNMGKIRFKPQAVSVDDSKRVKRSLGVNHY